MIVTQNNGGKMKYSCRECEFMWEGNPDTFSKVLEHEKTHKKSQKQNGEELGLQIS